MLCGSVGCCLEPLVILCLTGGGLQYHKKTCGRNSAMYYWFVIVAVLCLFGLLRGCMSVMDFRNELSALYFVVAVRYL